MHVNHPGKKNITGTPDIPALLREFNEMRNLRWYTIRPGFVDSWPMICLYWAIALASMFANSQGVYQ